MLDTESTDALALVRTLARELTSRGSIGPAGDVLDMLASATYDGTPTPGPTFRAWCEQHDGAIVDTLQVSRGGRAGWMPLGRTLDAHTRATYATLDGSRRDYAGVRVISATARAVLAFNADFATVILYRVAG